MHVSWPVIRYAVCCCLMSGLLIAGVAPAAEEQAPQVVSGKITLSEQVGGTAQSDLPAAVPDAEAAADNEPAVSADDGSPRPQVIRNKIALPSSEAVTDAAPPLSPPAEDSRARVPAGAAEKGSVPPSGDGSVLPLAHQQGHLKAPYSYNPEGKIDPFEPLFRAKPKVEEPQKKKKRPKRVPRTPLEMVDISQLKLSAIIMAPSGNRALVEEASGKGYVIRVGTPIGIHWGEVVDIQIDRVIVEEEVEDLMGDYVKRNREMKLNKPTGE